MEKVREVGTFISQFAELGAVVAVGLALITIWQTWLLNRAAAQPYVVVFLEAIRESKEYTPAVLIVVKNHGRTTARNIQLRFDKHPRVASIRINDQYFPSGSLLSIPDEIPSLVPGQEWRKVWDEGPTYFASELERQLSVTAIYRGIGILGGISRVPLKESYLLDWEMLNTQLFWRD